MIFNTVFMMVNENVGPVSKKTTPLVSISVSRRARVEEAGGESKWVKCLIYALWYLICGLFVFFE